MFKVVIKRIEVFRSIIQSLSCLCPEFKFVFNKDSLDGSGMNKANISASFFKFNIDFFEDYVVSGDNEVVFNLVDLDTVIKKFKDGGELILTSNDDNSLLVVEYVFKDKKFSYSLATFNFVDIVIPQRSDMDLDFKFPFSYDDLNNAISSVSFIDKSDGIVFNVSSGEFSLVKSSKGNIRYGSSLLGLTDVKEVFESKYNVEELSNMIICGKKADVCFLKFDSDKPVMLFFETVGLFKVWFMLAPIVKND